MKRVAIISTCLAGLGRTLFAGSVLDLDDEEASAIVSAQRGRFVGDDVKLKDTSKDALKDADARAEAAAKPEAGQAALIAQMVQEQVAKLLGAGADTKPAATTASTAS